AHGTESRRCDHPSRGDWPFPSPRAIGVDGLPVSRDLGHLRHRLDRDARCRHRETTRPGRHRGRTPRLAESSRIVGWRAVFRPAPAGGVGFPRFFPRFAIFRALARIATDPEVPKGGGMQTVVISTLGLLPLTILLTVVSKTFILS